MDLIFPIAHFDSLDQHLARDHFCNYEKEMTSDGKETVHTPPSTRFILWCPFCDEWSCRDSMIARKRLGLHVSNSHPEEVRFAKTAIPPKLEEL